MFYYEQKRHSYCVPATRENFYQTIDNPFLANDIKKIRAVSAKMEAATDEKVKAKLHDQKGKLKAELPAWVFSAGFIAKSEKTLKGDKRPCRAEWRKSEYAKLNGLVMLDIDHITHPQSLPKGGTLDVARQMFGDMVKRWENEGNVLREDEGTKVRGGENTPAADGNLVPSSPRPLAPSTSWCSAFCKHYGILFVHVTSSGFGLRLVFKGDANRGNIADNQKWLAGELGVKFDDICKDSVRNSFCCTREDIIYLELENLLNYNDEEFEKKFGEDYRKGRTAPTTEPADSTGVGAVATFPSSYRGVSYLDICTGWMRTFRRSLPAVGERNNAYFALVSQCLRYICDFNEDFVVGVAPDYGLSEQERRACARSAISQRRLSSMPKKLRTFLEGLGCRFDGDADAAAGTVDAAQWDFSRWSKTFGRWFDNPVWKPVCAYLPESARINGLLAAGSMWGTLLSGCHLRNWYDGSDLYLTFMTYIIGEAASGKGDYREIDRLIMEPLRQADERGRKAEEAYQEKMKQLSVSKAKKDDVPEEKHFAVRYLPTDTTLKQKLERCRYALAQFGAEQRQVACYNFETELSSKINYEKNSWNSSQDFDKKSFDCEMTGSESRSSMTTNGLVNAFFNFVVTGTPDALQKKINARNCLDGLPTRLLMGIQPPSGYRMIERSRRRRPDKDSDFLRTVGNKLMQCGWDVNLEQECNVPKAWQDRLGKKTSFADALYWWGQQKALTCELEEDKIGNYFRKRAPMIAVKLGVVDAIMNSLDSFVDEGQINLNFSSIELAIHLCDYIFESQIWYFGKLIEDSLESSAISGHIYQNTKLVKAYNDLPDNFTRENIIAILNCSKKTAYNRISDWLCSGYIQKVSTNKYLKLIKVLI
jgi:hypothetical protein